MGIRTRRTAVLVGVALLTVASLGLLVWQRVAGPPAVVSGTTATVDGVTADVRQAGWVDFDHGHVMDLDGGSGFMMPDEMMPGAPSLAGDEVRLRVDLTLANTGDQVAGFNLLDEFSVIVDDTEAPLVADTFDARSRLAPQIATDGTLYFDLTAPDEGTDPELYLQWERNGDAVRVPLELTEGEGEPPVHDH